jgi:hypothetical protein
MSKVQLHKIEKGKGDRVLDFFVAIGAISQVVIGIILILQLVAYRQSNELSRKAIILSHTPWLSVTKLGIIPDASGQIIITFHVENHSDYPVFRMKSVQRITTDNFTAPIPDMNAILDSRDSNDSIMPHDERFFMNPLVPANMDGIREFYSNRASLVIYIRYEDMFHRKMMFENTVRATSDSPVTWRVIDSKIDGVDNFNVNGL